MKARRFGRPDRGPAPEPTVPSWICEVIGRRVTRLPEKCGKMLELASVFGREFSLPPLEQLSGMPASETAPLSGLRPEQAE